MHANGATEVRRVVWNVARDKVSNIEQLTDDERLELADGHGFGRIEMKGWDCRVLNQPYYK